MQSSRRTLLLSLSSATLALASGSLCAPLFAQQKTPEEGFEYRLLSPPLPPESATKVEVLEFFWYGCPHCYAFEPSIEPWIKTLPGDVVFRRVPAVFYEAWLPHAKLYYALEVLGETERLHGTVFNAIHQSHQALITEAEIGTFLEANGISRKKFTAAWNSFSVQSKIQRSTRLQTSYKIEGVPAMGVDGLYMTANTMTADGKHESVLPVVDYLIIEARKQHKSALA
jgi:thiol:disulfide interchange protein DsbA